MKLKNYLNILIGVVMTAALLTGCGSSSGKTVTENTTENTAEEINTYDVDNRTFDNVKIKVAARYTEGGDAESDYYISKVNEFNEMGNGITVEMINITEEADYLNRLSTDFASGDAPNVFLEYGGSRCLDYVESNALLDLNPYFEADPDWYEGFYSTHWDPVVFENYGFDGIYGVPWGSYQVILYYNKAILEENGIEVPKNWDELMEDCKTLKNNGVSPFMVGEKDIYRFGHLHSVLSLKTYGADIAEKLGTREVAYDSDEMLAIYGMIKEMVDNGYLGDGLLNTGAAEERANFGEGKCAFMYDTSRAAAALQDTELLKNGEIGAASFPYVKEEYANVEMGGASSAYYVSTMDASEEQIAASVVFLKYITNTDYVNGLISVYPNTYAVKTTVESENYLYNDILDVMSSAQVYKTDLQNYDSASHMISTVRNALQILAMDFTPEDVGKQIADTIAQYE